MCKRQKEWSFESNPRMMLLFAFKRRRQNCINTKTMITWKWRKLGRTVSQFCAAESSHQWPKESYFMLKSTSSGINPGDLSYVDPQTQAISADGSNKGFNWTQRRQIKTQPLHPFQGMGSWTNFPRIHCWWRQYLTQAVWPESLDSKHCPKQLKKFLAHSN